MSKQLLTVHGRKTERLGIKGKGIDVLSTCRLENVSLLEVSDYAKELVDRGFQVDVQTQESWIDSE